MIRAFKITIRHSHLLHTICCYFLPLSMPVRTRSFLGIASPHGRIIPVTTTTMIPDRQISSTPKKRTRHSNTFSVVTPSPASKKVLCESSPLEDEKSAETKPTKRKKQQRSQSVVSKTFDPPKDWRLVYSLVEELRKDRTAPCDHSGCEALVQNGATAKTARFQILLSLMLSSQTKDAVVGEAVRRMQRDGVANVESITAMTLETLNAYIAKVGFHNNKTKYILAAAKILQEQYGGDIPPTAKQLMELPGVGPKMAYICESAAFGTQSGIGVDTHMHRIFNSIDFVNTKTPEQTRHQLQSWLPREYWADVNLLFVGFGQEVQQFKTKILHKAINSSRPREALSLLKRCGLDYNKVGNELGVNDRLREILEDGTL